MEFPGGGGSTVRPSGTENPGGWGGQTGKTLRGGGMDIFWNHTIKRNMFSFHLVMLYYLMVEANGKPDCQSNIRLNYRIQGHLIACH